MSIIKLKNIIITSLCLGQCISTGVPWASSKGFFKNVFATFQFYLNNVQRISWWLVSLEDMKGLKWFCFEKLPNKYIYTVRSTILVGFPKHFCLHKWVPQTFSFLLTKRGLAYILAGSKGFSLHFGWLKGVQPTFLLTKRGSAYIFVNWKGSANNFC